ncbi:MAG TPA: prepilin-type N-terminal cleavage/methylation domain-containing protein [Verrucomicrobiae bacterium]|nr:prepilin-type N-terminal cleavage/methylation domain-containing protein [Verrucomicrobiae bacterium]
MKRRAFTLVELLVVIAIIAILAALIMPVLSSAKKKAVQTECLSNYKNVGVALQLFVDEHDDQLPPGGTNSLFLTELPVYSAEGDFNRHLSYYLASYLSMPAPEQSSGVTNLIKVMLCPAYVKGLPGNTEGNYQPESDAFSHAYCFAVSRYTLNPPTGFPFGLQGADEPAMKLSALAALKPLSEAWATADLDWDATVSPESLGSNRTPYVAMAPVHGATRTALFFDMHVDKIKNENWQAY